MTITQHTSATVGGGSIVDEMKHTYEGWGKLDAFEQDRNSTVGAGGSVDDYEVNHDYDDRTGGRHTVIRTQTTYPDGVVVSMEEVDNASSIGDSFEQARTHRVKVGATTVSEYAYLGSGHVVGTELPQPDVFSRRWTAAATYRGTGPVQPSGDIDEGPGGRRASYNAGVGYDETSNITRPEDNIRTAGAAGSGNGLFDVAYTMDGANRLTQSLKGHWSGSAITVANRDEIKASTEIRTRTRTIRRDAMLSRHLRHCNA